MRESDFPSFATLLDDVAGLKRETYTPGQKLMFFRALSAHSIDEVRAGLDAHVKHPKNGRFLPMPADVIGQIEHMVADDGRPGAEEAWATAMRSADEAETIVWTVEAAEAFGFARPVLMAGDEVGARMAFKEVYTKLVDGARRERRPVAWMPSLGFDPKVREVVLSEAVRRNLLPASVLPMLPAPRGPVLLLEHMGDEGIPEAARSALLALRDWLTKPKDETSPDAAARAETEARKKAAAAQVSQYGERLQ